VTIKELDSLYISRRAVFITNQELACRLKTKQCTLDVLNTGRGKCSYQGPRQELKTMYVLREGHLLRPKTTTSRKQELVPTSSQCYDPNLNYLIYFQQKMKSNPVAELCRTCQFLPHKLIKGYFVPFRIFYYAFQVLPTNN
jgi:hypothetical protein